MLHSSVSTLCFSSLLPLSIVNLLISIKSESLRVLLLEENPFDKLSDVLIEPSLFFLKYLRMV